MAHALSYRLTQVRKEGKLSYLRPDGKAQVTVEYRGHAPFRVDTVVVRVQHDPDIGLAQINRDIKAIRPLHQRNGKPVHG